MLIHECFFVKVNFFSYIQMAWKALPSLEKNKGSLVIVSSLAGRFVFIVQPKHKNSHLKPLYIVK